MQGDAPAGSEDQIPWIAVIGDRTGESEPQEAIAPAVGHAAARLGVTPPAVRWIGTPELDRDGVGLLDGAAGAWCAPGSPFLSLGGALDGIRWAREQRLAFLGTCAGFQHGVLEMARNVLGHGAAAHAEYPDRVDGDDVVIHELLCSLVGQVMDVEVVDPELRSIYGSAHVTERYYCRFGLDPRWREPLEAAGLRVAGVDARDGDVRIMRLANHHFHVLTLFVPQSSSTPERPHPLVTGFVAALTGARAATA